MGHATSKATRLTCRHLKRRSHWIIGASVILGATALFIRAAKIRDTKIDCEGGISMFPVLLAVSIFASNCLVISRAIAGRTSARVRAS